MSEAAPEDPQGSGGRGDPWTPDALSTVDQPSVSDGMGEMKEGASKLVHGAIVLLIAALTTVAALLWRKSVHRSPKVSFQHSEHGWVAYLDGTNYRSGPMPTREEAFDDLEENISFAAGDLQLSDETIKALEETDGELDEGDTVSLEDVTNELRSDAN